MDFLQQLKPFFDLTIQFIKEYDTLLLVIALVTLPLTIIRKWPDRAEKVFLGAGVRAPKGKIEDLRAELAKTAADAGRQTLRAITEQQLKIEAMKNERERVGHLIRTSPLLVKEVGEALQAIEKQYLHHVKMVKSEQAKEVLRLAAEKGMNEVVRSVGNTSNQVPAFHIPDQHNSSEG